MYRDIFDRAEQELGIKTIYSVTEPGDLSPAWKGHIGRITAQLIRAQVPDHLDWVYYISGPQTMVDSFKSTLSEIGIGSSRIKTDLFAGLV